MRTPINKNLRDLNTTTSFTNSNVNMSPYSPSFLSLRRSISRDYTKSKDSLTEKESTSENLPPLSRKAQHYLRLITFSSIFLNIAVGAQWANLLIIPSLYNALGLQFGYSTSELGFIETMTSFSMFLSLPFWGALASKVNRRYILSFTTALTALTCGIHILCSTYWSFILVAILSGVSMGAVLPVGRSLVSTYYPLEKRGVQYGLFQLSSGIGGM